MALRVIVRSSEANVSPTSEEPSMLFDSPRIVLGRGESCDLRLPDPTVSSTHASLRQRGSDYLLVDEGSTNGTALGGVRLAPQSPRVVRNGELIRLGRVWLELRFEPGLATPQPVLAAHELALTLVTRGLQEQGEDGRPRVRVVAGRDRGKELVFTERRRYVVGRGKEVDLYLDDEGVARRHLSLGLKGAHGLVQDLAGRSDSLLAGAPLGPAEVVWRRELELRIGTNELRLVYPAAEALAELERGPDEVLGEEELPAPSQPKATASESADTSSEGSGPAASNSSEGPALKVRRSVGPTPEAAPSSSWTRLDLAVLLVATGVLLASALGLYSLLRR